MVRVRPRSLILFRLCQVTNEKNNHEQNGRNTGAKGSLEDYRNQGLVAQRLKPVFSNKQKISGSRTLKNSHFISTFYFVVTNEKKTQTKLKDNRLKEQKNPVEDYSNRGLVA